MRVFDGFSGTGGWSQAFYDRGHEVVRVDNDERFSDVPATTIADLLSYTPVGSFDVMLFSPPCQAFSLGAGGTHMQAMAPCHCGRQMKRLSGEFWDCECGNPVKWGDTYLIPRSEFGKLSVMLVERTLELVREYAPRYWWLENPNGGMIHFVPESIPRVQVTYCQYGDTRMKLTNLWGYWPRQWHPRPRCHNGDPCHESAPRGARTGTQGLPDAAARAVIPYELSMEVCLAAESGG